MSQGQFSPVMLIAADGLLLNQGIAVNGNLVIAIDDYTSTDEIEAYTNMLTLAAGSIGTSNTQITQSTFNSLRTLGAGTAPALTNSVPSAFAGTFPLGNTYTGGFSGLVTNQANLVLGSGDLTIFAQVYNIAQSFIVQTNQYVNTAENANYTANTFINMNTLTTGSISNVNRDLVTFSADLVKLGQTWDLSNLTYFGYPWALIYQTAKVAGLLPEFVKKFTDAGINQSVLFDIAQTGTPVTSQIDLELYRVMLNITGPLLDQIKFLLDVTTSGLTTMADLLNPVRALPNSYSNLTVLYPTGTDVSPTAVAIANVYVTNSTAVNSNLELLFAEDDYYLELKKIIPADQALANMSIARSLLQVKNIFSTTLPELAVATGATETNAGLPAIQALTQPVPTSVQTSLLSILATGTGPNGTLTLFDFFGAAAGDPYTELFANTTVIIDSLQTSGALDTLDDPTDGVWVVMENTLNGDYTTVIDPNPPGIIDVTIPSGLPGAGTYTSVDEAFTVGLIPAAANLIANIASAYPSQVTSLNSNFNTMCQQLVYETNNLTLAGVNFAEITGNNRASVLSLGSSLHDIGVDVTAQGQAEFFEAVAVRSNIYGQAIIASMREGRNIAALNEVGIELDTQIPDTLL